MDLTIKEAEIGDVKNLVELDQIASKEIKPWAPQLFKEFKKSLQNPKFCFLIAYFNDKRAGYLESEYDRDKDFIWIKNIYVLKEFRKRGISRKLVEKCVHKWKSKSNLFVLLTSDKNVKTFERLKFKKTMNYMVYKGKSENGL